MCNLRDLKLSEVKFGLWYNFDRRDLKHEPTTLGALRTDGQTEKKCNLRGLKMSEVNESVQKTWISGRLKKGA